MRTALCLLLLVGLVFAQEGEEGALKRGFEDGKYVDEYFGLVYEAKELSKGYAMGGPTTLFSGRCAEGVEVELVIREAPHAIEAAEFMALVKKSWAEDENTRTEMEEGLEPIPWVLFVQESLAGFKRHHGYGFYARGNQIFTVHAQVREKSETSGAAIRTALAGLKLDAESTQSYLLAHLIAKQQGADPRDPRVLAGAGQLYVDQTQQFLNPAMALEVLDLAVKKAPEGTFSDAEMWGILQGKGLAQLLTGAREESIPTWNKLIEMAGSTENAKASEANARYNLACAYSLLERLDEAFSELSKSLAIAPPEQGLSEHAQTDPDLENMRKAEARWKALFNPGDGGSATPPEED